MGLFSGVGHIGHDILQGGEGLLHGAGKIVPKPLRPLLPVAGAVGGAFLGGPWGAALGGGLGEVAAGGDINQGLVAGGISGLGAYGVQQLTAPGTFGNLTGGAGAFSSPLTEGGVGESTGVSLGGESPPDWNQYVTGEPTTGGGYSAYGTPGWANGGRTVGPYDTMGFPGLGNPGWATTALGLLSAGYNIYQGSQYANAAKQAAQNMDPFGGYRKYYGKDLQNLMQNPSSITEDPTYKLGLTATERQLAARGYRMSDNERQALADYTMHFAQDKENQLYQYAGGGATPGAGQPLLMQGNLGQMQATNNALANLGWLSYRYGA